MVPKPILLIVLDGWGLAPPGPGNAISLAKTPNMDQFWVAYPHAKLQACGKAVGLPEGELGGSETGHLTLGAGRVIYQDFSRISLSIANGSFFKNKAFVDACQQAKTKNSQLHYLGLLSSASVHADRDHLYALLHLAKKQGLDANQLKLHIFTDGRDSPPQSAHYLVRELKTVLEKIGVGKIVSLSGRYFAMDRDRRWERTQKTYQALVSGKGEKADSVEKAIEKNYQQKVTDEFFPPTIIDDGLIKDDDAVIFYNFRTDRARQLTRAFVGEDFFFFKRQKKLKIFFATMTEFEKNLPVSAVAFAPREIKMVFPKILAERGLQQLRIAETEKYAFVTYYFNGLHEKGFPEEERIAIPSPKVATYDLKPEMSAYKITDTLLKKIKKSDYDFILINFANPDMLGHTGNLKAGIKACEVVDDCLGKIVRLVLAHKGACIIVADHGNLDEMIDPGSGQVSTQHSLNFVPLIFISQDWRGQKTNLPTGTLADVAPSILKIMNIPQEELMTGNPLL